MKWRSSSIQHNSSYLEQTAGMFQILNPVARNGTDMIGSKFVNESIDVDIGLDKSGRKLMTAAGSNKGFVLVFRQFDGFAVENTHGIFTGLAVEAT